MSTVAGCSVGTFPISVDNTTFDGSARAIPTSRRAPATLRTELGDPEQLLLGVDRLDYTKGIDQPDPRRR